MKLLYIRFGEDFTGWLPNDWFGSLICKGMISNWVQGRNGVRNAMARYLRLAGHVKSFVSGEFIQTQKPWTINLSITQAMANSR